MPGPLHGYRIVDLSQIVSGPMATMLLSDQGADVVKVEPVDGQDVLRRPNFSRGGFSAFFLNNNRGKRSLAVDLHRTEGRQVILDLVATADVFVQNFRPGVCDRMGLGYEDLRAVNPDLVYVSISGFGPTGPYADRPILDPVIQGLTGMVAYQVNPDIPFPDLVRNIVSDKSTALTVAQAITAALLARERGAGGQHLELSMLDACIAFLFVDGAEHEVILEGDYSGPQSVAANNTPLAFDGGFAAVTVPTDKEFHGLARAMGVDSSDPELATVRDRTANREKAMAFHRAVRENATRLTVSEAEALLEANQVPFGIVRAVNEIQNDPQVIANGIFSEFDHPAAGRVRHHRPPTRFHGTPTELREPAAPTLGQHSDEILAETGRADRIDELRTAGVVG